MNLIERARRLFSPAKSDVSRPKARAAYMNGGANPVFRMWPGAPLRDPRDDVRAAWNTATARMVDMIHNSGWIAGMIDQAVASTVGTGLRLSAKPDAEALGISTQEAAELGRQFERRWEAWSECPYDCDIEGRQTFGALQAQALKSWFATGEILAEIPFRRRTGGLYGTKVRAIPAHRLVQTSSEFENIHQGVKLDADGMPIGYRLKKRFDGVERDVDVRARDPEGRTLVLHVFDGMPSQVRGITPLVPVLKVARRFDQLSDATLTAALIQAVFAATIKSAEPTEQMLAALTTPQEQARAASQGQSQYDCWFDAQQGWYDATNIDLGLPGRIAHLFPGQDMQFLSSQTPNSTYKDFALHLLREMARCAGVTFEDATGDYTGATYSSVRMATSSIFAITMYRRKNVIAPFCQPVYEAVIEEDIDAGRIAVPGGIYNYMLNRTAFCRSEWKGTAKPQADDLKLAEAHKVWLEAGVITREYAANDLGLDYEDVVDGLAREAEMRAEKGVPEPVMTPTEKPLSTDEPPAEERRVAKRMTVTKHDARGRISEIIQEEIAANG